jgi:endonuclease YncB( thermonuclease family)
MRTAERRDHGSGRRRGSLSSSSGLAVVFLVGALVSGCAGGTPATSETPGPDGHPVPKESPAASDSTRLGASGRDGTDTHRDGHDLDERDRDGRDRGERESADAGEAERFTEPERDGDVARVVHIVDGDTFDVEFPDGTVERIRPPQIDTPEIGECGFAEATAALDELISGREVWLIPTADGPDRDTYDRLLRAVEVDGQDIGEQLIRAGHARWVSRYAEEDSRLAALYAPAEVSAEERTRAERVLRAVGEVVWVDDERLLRIDRALAVGRLWHRHLGSFRE